MSTGYKAVVVNRWIIGLLALSLFAGGCVRRRTVLLSRTPTPLPRQYAHAEVRDAIFRAARARRMQVERESEGALLLAYGRGRIFVQLLVHYTPTSVRIDLHDSDGLYLARDSDGRQWVDTRYDRIVAGLERQIQRELDRLEPQPVTPTVAAVPPGYAGAPQSCEAALAERGYVADPSLCFNVEPWCARELLHHGHPAPAIVHCRGVEPSCAVQSLRAGVPPAGLERCRFGAPEVTAPSPTAE